MLYSSGHAFQEWLLIDELVFQRSQYMDRDKQLQKRGSNFMDYMEHR